MPTRLSRHSLTLGSPSEEKLHTIIMVWIIVAGICAFLANVIAASMMTI